MHDHTVCICDRPRRSEKFPSISTGLAAVILMVALGICTSGCSQQTQRARAASSVTVRVDAPADRTSYSLAEEDVTVEGFRSLVAGSKGRSVVVCIWSAASPDAGAALSEALQWQAQHGGSAVLGICLDPGDTWADKAVPVLRKVGAPFPCVTIAPGHQRQVLALCGVGQADRTARIVLLDEAGRPISPAGELLEIPEVPSPATASGPATQVGEEVPATQIAQDAPAVPPAGTKQAAAGSEHAAAGIKQAAAGVPAEQATRAESPATRPASGGNATVLLLYSLQMVRLSDSTKVAEHRGTVVWQDVVPGGGTAGEEGLALRRLGLSRLGQEIASKVSHEGAVGICPLRGVGGGDGSANLAEAFAEGLSKAIQEAGGKALEPAEVNRALKRMGMGSSAVVLQSGALKASLKATFLVTGTVTVSTMREEKGTAPNDND